MAAITFDHATLRYPGAARPAIDALDLEIADGELLVLVGPSGCGKSTALRMLAGLEQLTGGAIRIGDRDVTRRTPRERDVAMVFQNYALYPHMTVADNIGFALKVAGMNKHEIGRRVREAARILGLEQHLEDKPAGLSGGQRQRIAMGRAIVRHPQAFLMDEPLSNLDAPTRVQTRSELAALQRRLGVTTVYVTHDQMEAMTIGDRVAVLRDGVLQQVDAPRDVYDRPVNVFVARFIGSPKMNVMEAELTGSGAVLGGHAVPLPRAATAALAAEQATAVLIGFRPESVEFVGPGEGFPVEVVVTEELGSHAYTYGTPAAGNRAGGADELLVAQVDSGRRPVQGEVVHLRIRRGEEHVFSPGTGLRLGTDEG
jgi:multiple sugar transport system ATP-binding protein